MKNATTGREIGGRQPQLVQAAYCQYGLPGRVGPLVVTIPHAGREYPADLLAMARAGLPALRSLEDRHVDALVTDLIGAGQCVLMARRGRAAIDLNRHAEEIDAASVSGIPHGVPTRTSAKLRGGLGLVPHHYHGLGDLWRRRPSYAEVCERIETLYKPYHDRVAALLAATAALHGEAVLLDLHSMPPLRCRGDEAAPQVVIGDRFGQSAGDGLARRVAAVIADHDVRVAINAPYAGGHTLERHGAPGRGVHALQIEIDRTLYLDRAMDGPGAGAARWNAILTEIARELSASSAGDELPLAAE